MIFSLSLYLSISCVVQAQSPYISKVFEFKPAPGQFVNELPQYEVGDTYPDILRKVEESICGTEKVLVSLGGYGGTIVFGFDHMVENKAGKYDFKIWGNAFYADANPNPNAPAEGGSCEPGIVLVSYDANQNGIPDDLWYELAGSEYFKSQTLKKYQITYYKPISDKQPTPDSDYPYLNDITYIKWKSNRADSGYIARNTFHAQSYYPLWCKEDSLVFQGTKLANNYIDESGEGKFYVQYAYRWGYADNHPNNRERSGFDISWAVDSTGNSVTLPGIHFVKVYTGVNQYCGWLGETSTEIMGAEDLHLQGTAGSVSAYTEGIKLNTSSLVLEKNEEKQLSARVFSSNPSLESIEWTSGDNNLVSVDESGNIIALSKGNTYVATTVANGLFSDTCLVVVTETALGVVSPDALDQTTVRCYDGALYLQNLKGSTCRLVSSGGQVIDNFYVSNNDETRPLKPAVRGLYLLYIEKQGTRKIVKVIVQ